MKSTRRFFLLTITFAMARKQVQSSAALVAKVQSIALIPDTANTGIRTYRTENFSPTAHTHSMFSTVWYSDIPDFLYTGL